MFINSLYNYFMNHPHTVIVIAGPTAVGKRALAVALAQQFNTCIISADSRQCFSELSIGVARPSVEELSAVHHYFIASHSIHDNVNAGTFEQYALRSAAEIFRHHKVAVMVGGTGLYMKAFCEGIDNMPAIPAEVRTGIRDAYEKEGLPFLQQELKEKDPDFWVVAEQQNPQRLMRALEVLYATGSSILHYRTAEKTERPFNIVKIGLELPREQLVQNINTRTNQMMEQGLLQEAEGLRTFNSLNALQTVGYKELFDCFNGASSLPEAVEKIKINTRQYAKRQMTWFKKDSAIQWFHPAAVGEIAAYIQAKLR